MTARYLVFFDLAHAHPRISLIFEIFKLIIQYLQQIIMKQIHLVSDSNSQPLVYDSPPIIT